MKVWQQIKAFSDWLVPVGPRSVLFGAHQFLIHPYFVLKAWKELYGWPKHPAIWLAILVHDWGYFFMWCRKMDDERGELHPEFGARIVGAIFGPEWHDFVRHHSRFLSKRDRAHFSRLCVADKYAIVLTPAWIYLPMVRATGEIREYMATYGTRSVSERDINGKPLPTSEEDWHEKIQTYMRQWVETHRDGSLDTWTQNQGS